MAFIMAQVHPASLFSACTCLHGTVPKAHVGLGHTSVRLYSRLLYWSEIFIPEQEPVTISCKQPKTAHFGMTSISGLYRLRTGIIFLSKMAAQLTQDNKYQIHGDMGHPFFDQLITEQKSLFIMCKHPLNVEVSFS